MTKRAILLLEDGSIFEGQSIGSEASICGEVVFNTSMAGYQELLTNPTNAGQIIVMTYPLIGNCGINQNDFESLHTHASGLVAHEICDRPSNYQCQMPLPDYLKKEGIAAITGLDTRAITRNIQSKGVMKGIITSTLTPQEAFAMMQIAPKYDDIDFAKDSSTKESYDFTQQKITAKETIAIIDFGCPNSLLKAIERLGYYVKVLPCTTTAKEVLSLNPSVVFLSPGPGNPAKLEYAVYSLRGIIGYKTIIGMGLGHQLVAQAFGGKTFKLKFGHRSSNQPVREVSSGKVFITSQNHGYAVDPDNIASDLEITQINLNDQTIEGLRHKVLPIASVQYIPDTVNSALDGVSDFERFMKAMTIVSEG